MLKRVYSGFLLCYWHSPLSVHRSTSQLQTFVSAHSLQIIFLDFQGAVVPLSQFINATAGNIKTDGWVLAGEFYAKGQADIAQAWQFQRFPCYIRCVQIIGIRRADTPLHRNKITHPQLMLT